MRSKWLTRRALATSIAVTLLILTTVVASAATLLQISSDPFTNTTSQHKTEVEPDTFAFGNTIVSAFQVGRFFDGGASDIGFATSTNGGTTWTQGFLPGITKFQGGGTFDRVSDASVAFDPKHNVWLISSIPILENPSIHVPQVFVSRSTNGGLTWGNPVIVGTGTNLDKNWTVCDTTSTSQFFGNCYTEWDDNGNGNRIKMSTSSDGGLTWGAAKNTGNNATGLGGQPVVQPNGNVIVPIDNANETTLLSFRSLNGGSTWRSTVTISSITDHVVAGGLRTGPLPSAEVDGAGKVYVVWQDCRFEANCSANDIVMSTTTDGLTWTAPVRIPIDAVGSGVDHFIPGLAVDRATSGATAHLALAFYFYPNANCTAATCQLEVGFVSSTNGGASWTAKTTLAGPMNLSWIANTSQGRMVADYISTSFVNGVPRPVFASATAPTGSTFNENMFTSLGLSAAAGSIAVNPNEHVLSTTSDRPAQGAHNQPHDPRH